MRFISDVVYGVYQVQKCILGHVHQLSPQECSESSRYAVPPSPARSSELASFSSWWKWCTLDLKATDSHFMLIWFFFFFIAQVFLTSSRSLWKTSFKWLMDWGLIFAIYCFPSSFQKGTPKPTCSSQLSLIPHFNHLLVTEFCLCKTSCSDSLAFSIIWSIVPSYLPSTSPGPRTIAGVMLNFSRSYQGHLIQEDSLITLVWMEGSVCSPQNFLDACFVCVYGYFPL